MSKQVEKEEQEHLESQITQHSALHNYYAHLLDVEGNKPLYERTDPVCYNNKDEPVVIKLLDHYLNSGCQKTSPDGGSIYSCGKCERTMEYFKKSLHEKQPFFSMRQRLQRQLRV